MAEDVPNEILLVPLASGASERGGAVEVMAYVDHGLPRFLAFLEEAAGKPPGTMAVLDLEAPRQWEAVRQIAREKLDEAPLARSFVIHVTGDATSPSMFFDLTA